VDLKIYRICPIRIEIIYGRGKFVGDFNMGNFICESLGVKFTQIMFSHFSDRPVPIFSHVRFSYLALVQDKKITCVLPANA
jgi:hypothetical protein